MNQPYRRATEFGFGLWLILVVALLTALTVYAAAPGADDPGLQQWPTQSAIPRTPGRGTLVCFVHPRCACTEATLRELERVVSRAPGANIQIVFREDPNLDLATSATWQMAELIPEAARMLDVEGREAARFGARTSGLVLLFNAQGTLQFRGGVTAGRGHEGDNAGALALEAALRSGTVGQADVFGCGLEKR